MPHPAKTAGREHTPATPAGLALSPVFGEAHLRLHGTSPVTNTVGEAHLRLNGTTGRRRATRGIVVAHRLAQRRGLVVVNERPAGNRVCPLR